MINSMISMNPKIRVTVSPEFKDIYKGLKTSASIEEYHELFFLCVCLGCKTNRVKPLSKKEALFWSNTIKPVEWCSYYSIFLHKNNMKFEDLGNDEEVIFLMQEYANGGMEFLIEDFLHDYIKKNSSGQYIVENTDEISKQLLAAVILDWGK